jgi:hypothetical protein
MLHLHCTAKLAKALKVTLVPAPDENGMDWLDCWYVRDIPLDLPLDALLFTNAATNYSMVHPLDKREPIDEIVLVFQQRLAWTISKPVPRQSEPYQVCKSSSRRVIGCMNEQVETLLYEVDRQLSEDGVQFEKVEDHLNAGISGGLFPKDEFQRRLDQGAFPKLKGTKFPHLRIVED